MSIAGTGDIRNLYIGGYMSTIDCRSEAKLCPAKTGQGKAIGAQDCIIKFGSENLEVACLLPDVDYYPIMGYEGCGTIPFSTNR